MNIDKKDNINTTFDIYSAFSEGGSQRRGRLFIKGEGTPFQLYMKNINFVREDGKILVIISQILEMIIIFYLLLWRYHYIILFYQISVEEYYLLLLLLKML